MMLLIKSTLKLSMLSENARHSWDEFARIWTLKKASICGWFQTICLKVLLGILFKSLRLCMNVAWSIQQQRSFSN